MNAEIKPIKTAAELKLAASFAAVSDTLPGGAVLSERRLRAFKHFEALGLPHRRIEEWKYTDLRALMRDAAPLAGVPSSAAVAAATRAGAIFGNREGTRRLLFVDGAFVAERSDLGSLEPGLSIVAMGTALAAGDAVVAVQCGDVVPTDDVAVALNTAFMGDGAVIRVADDAHIERPIHLVFVFSSKTAAAVFPRSLVIVGKRARLTLLESFEGPDGVDYQVNSAVELVVGDAANVTHVKVGREGTNALHLSTVMARVGAGSALQDVTVTVGGAVVRNQLFVRFAGEDARLTANSATLIRQHQHVDTTLVVDHAVPGGLSRELNKAVLDDESRGVFQGKIIVAPGAQKTDGKMMSQALLLSERAEADHKPELEIFADDVQCGHGATAGALDQDLLFYVKARGLPQKEAEALLIAAFVGEAFETIEHHGVKEALSALAQEWLAARA
ncbi:MAG TPA: Fe-S cluster assembly protein SufD [Xanthobacteraceae bacterium]|nr:Fe-S cluster assembly protein SufD [Xanthobacteraceae bacterium]